MSKTTTKTKDEKTESPTTTAQISRELKAVIDELPGDTFEDKVRGLLINKTVKDTPEDGMITLKMPETNYRRLLVMQSSTVLSDMLQKARV